MKEVFRSDLIIGEKRRLITRLYKTQTSQQYPRGLKFCVQYLYLRDKEKEEWLEIVRIDNYTHKNQTGTHIHLFRKKEVKLVEMSFQEAKGEAIRLGDKISALLEGETNGKNRDSRECP